MVGVVVSGGVVGVSVTSTTGVEIRGGIEVTSGEGEGVSTGVAMGVAIITDEDITSAEDMTSIKVADTTFVWTVLVGNKNVSVSIIIISITSSLSLSMGSAAEGCMLWAPHTLSRPSKSRRWCGRERPRREEHPHILIGVSRGE